MRLLNWFRRKPADPPPSPKVPPPLLVDSTITPVVVNRAVVACPHCHSFAWQTRADGRCVACGNVLPDELRDAFRSPREVRRKKPIVQDIDEVHVMVQADGMIPMVMDRLTYEYQFTKIEKPDPSQQALDYLLSHVAIVKVWAGGMFRHHGMTDQLLFEEWNEDAINAFRNMLRINEDPVTFSHCPCLGQPTIQLLDADAKWIGTLGLHHGRLLRWDYWKHDVEMLEREKVIDWLIDRGVTSKQMM